MGINQGQPFSLYDYRNIIGDPARPYLFLVHIPEIGSDAVITALSRSTSLPGITVNDVAIPFQGVNINIGGTPTFEEWNVTFLCDEAHELRRLFLQWNSLIYDVGTGNTGSSFSYKSDKLAVVQLGRNNVQVAKYGFVGAYPKTIGNIELNQAQSSDAETFQVTFKYDYFINVDQLGTQTVADKFVRGTPPRLSRGTPLGTGNFKPQ